MSEKKILIKKTKPPDEGETNSDAQEDLSPGDTIEFGLTEHVKANNGRETWVKYGVVSAVRAGETTEQAERRVGQHVNRNIQEAISSI